MLCVVYSYGSCCMLVCLKLVKGAIGEARVSRNPERNPSAVIGIEVVTLKAAERLLCK